VQLQHQEQISQEESKASGCEAVLSEFLVSTNSGDESGSGRNYKVVKSCLEFQRILFEYMTLARQFENLAADASLKLMEQI